MDGELLVLVWPDALYFPFLISSRVQVAFEALEA
jgi:hypothetical protein